MLKSLHLSKRSAKWTKATNEMGGNNPGENFLGANFPAGSLPGEGWWVGIFWVGNPPGEEFS